MSYYNMTEDEYELLEAAVIEESLLPAVHRNICNFTESSFAFESTWTKVMTPDVANIEVWSLAEEGIDNQSNVLFTPTTDKYYRLQMVVRIPQALIDASRVLNQSLDTIVVRQVARKLDKELEAFTFRGPKLRAQADPTAAEAITHDTAIDGLCAATVKANAGNESTYDTVKFATATGPYNTILDMKGLLLADGFGNGRLDVVADTTLYPYFFHLIDAAGPSEYTRIKQELLNGGDIYVSNKLPPKESDDGFLLLVENKRTNYEIKSPRGISLKNQFVWDPNSDNIIGRIEGYFCMSVYEPNAICIHANVDLAA